MAKYSIHESCFVDSNVIIGEGSKIWHYSHLMSNCVIGSNCVLGQNVFVGKYVVIGNNCKIQNNVSIYEGVELEDDVFCGPSMVFTNVLHPRSFIERKHEFKKTLVKKGSTIGANATVICGVTIGEYSMTGAGSVLTEDVPPYGLVMGNPGKLCGWVCRCGLPLSIMNNFKSVCSRCKTEYELRNQTLLLVGLM